MRYINDDDRDPTPDEQNAAWAAATLKTLAEKPNDQPFFLAVGFFASSHSFSCSTKNTLTASLWMNWTYRSLDHPMMKTHI